MWEQIQANRRRSLILIVGMALFLGLFGYIAGEGLGGPGVGWLGLIVSMLIWGIQISIYLDRPEKLLLLHLSARELERQDHAQLFNIVDEMRIASGLPFMPRIYLMDDPSPNAFAIGKDRKQGMVVVTSGLLSRLNRDELQGVIAHEVAHLNNQDSQFLTLAAVLLGSVVILSQWVIHLLRPTRFRRSSSRGGGGQVQLIFLVLALLFALLGPFFARFLYLACSRKREFLADACAAQFTRYPEGLASALEKISNMNKPMTFESKALMPMFIINPLQDARSSHWWSTHPSTEERIHILRKMGGCSLLDYEKAYQESHRGKLMRMKEIESVSSLPVRSPSSEGPVLSRKESVQLNQRLDGYALIPCSCGVQVSVPPHLRGNPTECPRCGNSLMES